MDNSHKYIIVLNGYGTDNWRFSTPSDEEIVDELWGRLCPDMGPQEWRDYILNKSTIGRAVNKEGSSLERALMTYIIALKLSVPIREYKFDDERKFRFDFAWPHLMIAVECEGISRFKNLSSQGHTSIDGYERNCQKYNLGTEQGWRIYRVTGQMIESGEAATLLERVLKNG
jgi:hypothetical protein